MDCSLWRILQLKRHLYHLTHVNWTHGSGLSPRNKIGFITRWGSKQRNWPWILGRWPSQYLLWHWKVQDEKLKQSRSFEKCGWFDMFRTPGKHVNFVILHLFHPYSRDLAKSDAFSCSGLWIISYSGKKKSISTVKMHFKTPLLLGYISLLLYISLIIWFTLWVWQCSEIISPFTVWILQKFRSTSFIQTDLTFSTKNTRA